MKLHRFELVLGGRRNQKGFSDENQNHTNREPGALRSVTESGVTNDDKWSSDSFTPNDRLTAQSIRENRSPKAQASPKNLAVSTLPCLTVNDREWSCSVER